MFDDFTTQMLLVGTALVGIGAAVAAGAYAVKALPMGARFVSKIWSAITGR